MATNTIRIKNNFAAQGRDNKVAKASPDDCALRKIAEVAPSRKHGHEDWTLEMEEVWQGHIESLQLCVCELLLKNQELRMALMATKEQEVNYGNSGNV